MPAEVVHANADAPAPLGHVIITRVRGGKQAQPGPACRDGTRRTCTWPPGATAWTRLRVISHAMAARSCGTPRSASRGRRRSAPILRREISQPPPAALSLPVCRPPPDASRALVELPEARLEPRSPSHREDYDALAEIDVSNVEGPIGECERGKLIQCRLRSGQSQRRSSDREHPLRLPSSAHHERRPRCLVAATDENTCAFLPTRTATGGTLLKFGRGRPPGTCERRCGVGYAAPGTEAGPLLFGST